MLLLVGLLVFLSFFSGCGKQPSSEELTIAHQWGGPEKKAFDQVLDAFQKKYPEIGLKRRSFSSEEYGGWILNQFAAGSPPDVFIVSSPGLMLSLARAGKLLPLDDLWQNWRKKGWYPESLQAISTFKGHFYAVPFKLSAKGLIWYSPKDFKKLKLSVPRTWDDWLHLLVQLKEKKRTPILVGGKDGWPLSDWFEQILLRVAGPKKFRLLAQHKVRWTDGDVKEAFFVFRQIIQQGFPEDPLAVGFVEAVHSRIDGQGFLQMQGGWVNLMTKDYKPSLVPGEDFAFFVLPPISKRTSQAVIVGGDLVLVAKSSQKKNQVKKLVSFLASAEAQSIWARKGGLIAPNATVEEEIYPDANAKMEAHLIKRAHQVLFDLDDMMPSGMQRVFWEKLQEFVQHRNVDKVVAELEEQASAFYKAEL